jgi:hypothetical protein
MEKDDDVGAPVRVIDDDQWPVRSGRAETVKGGRLQEGVKARKGLNSCNKLCAIIQKLPLPHHELMKRIHSLAVTKSIVVCREGKRKCLKLSIDRREFVCQMGADQSNLIDGGSEPAHFGPQKCSSSLERLDRLLDLIGLNQVGCVIQWYRFAKPLSLRLNGNAVGQGSEHMQQRHV